MKSLIGCPYILIKIDNNIKRPPRLMKDANKKSAKLILKAPALMVNNLKGIGVKPAVNIIRKLY